MYEKEPYKVVRIGKKTIREHRYVMEIFLGRPLDRNEHVHHIDGNKLNNSLDNLKVVTPEEHYHLHHS